MPHSKKLPFRPRPSVFALEPRVLFDGAGAVAFADQMADAPIFGQAQPTQEVPAAQSVVDFAGVTTSTPVTEQPQADAIDALVTDLRSELGTTVLIVDASVANYTSLLADLPSNVVVRVVEAHESGLAAITEALQGRSGVSSVQIISHGTPGSFTLGSDTVSNASLAQQASQLQGWATHLSDSADILLYGCDVAAGSEGRAFITELARLTGADIAASTDPTGSALQGGNWELEATTGSIEAGLALSAAAMQGYGELLAAPTVKDTAPADEPFSVGENTPKVVGNNITVTGTGEDSLTVTASVTKGTLSASTFTGNATAVQTWLDSLTYTYTDTSQTGDSEILTLAITNTTSGGVANFTRTIAIAPENDAPTMVPPDSGAGRLTVSEGGNVAFAAGAGTGTAGSPVTQINLGLSDLDNTQNQIIIKLTGLPGQGVLKLNGNELTVNSTFAVSDISKLKYHHNGDQVSSATTDTFQITVDDGAGALLLNQTVTVDITPVNQAPSVGGGIVLIEGETGVKLVGENIPVIGGSRGNLTIADPDDTAGTHTVQITSLPTHGELKYNGVAVSNGQTIANANLSLFTYDHDGSETTGDSFKIKVSDAGGGAGAGAAITTADQTVNLTIIPNNDDPYWNGTSGKEIKAGDQTVPNASNEFGTHVFGPTSGTDNLTTTLPITTAMLHVVDAESGPERLTYTLTSIPSGGYLTHSGYPGQYLPVGFTFTQAEIDAGKISFVNTTGNSHSTDFKFTVMDGDRRLFESGRDGGIYANEAAATPLTVHTFKIEYQGTATGTGHGAAITPAPLPSISGSLALTALQIAESQSFTLGASELSAVSTGATDAQITYRLLTLPSNGSIVLNGTALGLLGSFTQADINAGNVKFQHDGSEDFTASFTFDVSNGSQITAAQTFNIDVKPQNDTPTASNGDIVKLTEGASIAINSGGKTHITLSDSDNDSSDKITGYALDNVLSFKVTALPTHGTLKLDGTNVTVNQVISKADLDSSKLTYEHNGSENYTDVFTIVPLDDKNVASTTNNTDANANPPSGDPTNQTSEGAATFIHISVNPLNDAPTFKSIAEPGYGNVAALKEGTEFTIGGASSYAISPGYGAGSGTATVPADTVAQLVYEDSDNTSEQRQYRVTTATKYGTLTANGRVMGVGSVFTQAELDAGQVKYKHGGGEQFDDRFFYVVSDGDYGANASTSDNDTAFVQGTAITPSEYRIKLERANDKPTISTSHTGLFVVDSSVTAKTLPAITLGDKDIADGIQAGESDFVQITVQFLESDGTTPYTNGVLQFESGYNPASQGDGVTVTNAAGDSTLVFTGKLADVQAALAKVQARTNGNDADASNLKIKVTIDDRLGGGGANGGTINDDGSAPNDAFNTASITINVAASDKNDPPTVTVAAGPIVVNEDVRTLIDTAITAYTDPDAFDSTANSITLSVTKGTLYFSASGTTTPSGVTVTAGSIGSGSVTLQGSKTALDTALANLRYLSNTDYNGDDVLTVTVEDGGKNGLDGTDNSGSGSHTGTVNIAILPVNDTPTVTLPGADGYQSLTGGSYVFSGATAISIADAKDFTGTDGENGQQHGKDDNFKVTLNATLGANASYGTISVTTPGSLTIEGQDTGTVTLTGSRAAINAALASGVTFTPVAGNLDGTVKFTVTVDDNNNGGTALIDPTTNSAGITGPQTASKQLFLQPTAKNDAPVFADLDNTPTYVQNGSPVVLDGNALLSDPELDLFGASGNWNGAVLTLQRDGGANANDVFGTTGSGGTGVNFNGSNVRVGTTVVGTFTNAGGTLAIIFNTHATASHVDTVLQGLTYKNTDPNPSDSIKINYLIDDQNPNNTNDTNLPVGTGQDQGTGGKLIGTGSITIGINRQIVATPDTNAITEAVNSAVSSTVSGDVTPGTTNSNDHGGTQDRDPDASQTIVVQGVKAGTQADVAAVGTGGVGSSVTGTYGAVVINADGSYTYTLDNTNAVVNALKPGETLTDVFSYAINDGQGEDKTTAFTTLTITVNGANDPPVATPNTNSVTEDTGTPATGNVKTDGTPDSDPDNSMTEVPVTAIVATSAGGTSMPVEDSAGAGTVVAGKYGTLTIHPDGRYSYALDNNNADVNALNDLGTLTEVFTYTITDPDDSPASSTLTITIKGHTDGAPQIVPVDGNSGVTGEATVYEKGLTSAGDTTETTTGTLTVKAPDGIKSVTIGGTEFTVAELAALSSGSPSAVIDTGGGELRITGISNTVGAPGAPTSAEVSYTYTLKTAITNTAPADIESTDTIALIVTDNSAGAKTGLGNLVIQIIDDQPTAVADTNSITKGTATVTGNAFTNDRIGADGSATPGPITGITDGSLGTPLDGTYGTITLNADGTYTYALDNANSEIAGLMSGQTKTDTFEYTITDKDGDTSTATIAITINGVTPPNYVPVARDDSFTLNKDVPFTGTLTGNDTPSPDGGNVWSKTTDPSHGTAVVNPDGSYTYTPNPGYVGEDSFTYTITDSNGDKSTATVIITVMGSVEPPPVVQPPVVPPPVVPPPVVPPPVVQPPVVQPPVVPPPVEPPPVVPPPVVPPPVVPPPVVQPPVVQPPVEPPPVQLPRPVEQLQVRDVLHQDAPNAPLQPLNPLQGDQARIPSVFFDGAVFRDVPRLSIPLHPIVYVTPEVHGSQAVRERSDPLFFSNPLAAQRGGMQSGSIGAGLGMDPALFVQHMVRASQARGELLGDVVDGRLARVSLSSDGRIPTPDWFEPDASQLVPDMSADDPLPDQQAAAGSDAADAAAGANDQATEAIHAAMQPAQRTAAPSFSEQLRSAGARSPLATRAAPFVSFAS